MKENNNQKKTIKTKQQKENEQYLDFARVSTELLTRPDEI